MRFLKVGAAVISFIAAMPAAASDGDFWACDGYRPPHKKADGITTANGLFGLVTQPTDVRRSQAAPAGEESVAACGRALADPVLIDAFWVRRANLLQSLAFHQMNTEAFGEALKSLDRSDAIAADRGDPFFIESIGLANRMLRAVTLYRLDRKADARAILDAAETVRPYSQSLVSLSRAIRLSYDYDRESLPRQLRHAAPIQPGLIASLFWLSIMNDDFAAADLYGSQLSFDIPKGHGGWTIEGEDDRPYKLIADRAEFAGSLAYAKLALGHGDAAKAVIADAKADLADAVEPPVAPPNGKVSKRALADFERRTAAAGNGTRQLAAWEHLIALRERLAGQPLMTVFTALEKERPEDLVTVTDLFRQAKATTPDEIAGQKKLLQEIDDSKEKGNRKGFAIGLTQLLQSLPRPETAAMRPKMQRQGIGIMRTDANGFGIKRTAGSDLVTVSFGSEVAPRAMVEEGVMLAAAQFAIKEGKDSLLIDSAQSIERTTTVYGAYGGYQSTLPSGYEARLSLWPVSAASLPASMEPMRWRLIKAEDVVARLSPKFVATRETLTPK